MCEVADGIQYTPIITAVVNYRLLQGQAPTLIARILSSLASSDGVSKCIEIINYRYRGLSVIEDDIKSGRGIIVKV